MRNAVRFALIIVFLTDTFDLIVDLCFCTRAFSNWRLDEQLSPLLQIKKNYMALFICKALSILTARFHWVLFSFFPWYVGRDSLARVLLQSTSMFSVYFLQTSSKPSSLSQTVTSLRICLGRLGRSWLKRCMAGRSSDRWDFHTAMRPSRDPGPEITSPSSVRHIERTRSWWRDNSWNKRK